MLVDCVKKYLNEVAYQLCDGFAVGNGYFTVYPNITGTFSSISDGHDRKKHPINFKFRTGRLLRNLAQHIDVAVGSVEDGNAFIDQFIDNIEDSVNGLYVPGDVFTIYGNKIKLAGENTNVGVYFVPKEDPSEAVKVAHIVENFPSKIIGVAPKTGYQFNSIEIRTQYTASSSFLKIPRVITSNFVLEEA
jgi:hypothetical protein